MMNLKWVLLRSSLLLTVICCLPVFAIGQNSVTILTGAELNRVVPPGFYFQGLSAPTHSAQEHTDLVSAMTGRCRFWIWQEIKFS